MPGPPKAKTTDDLAEVEQALSVLGGRHPDHVRSERETNDAVEAKRRELDAEARRDRRRKLKVGVALVVAAGSLGYGVIRTRERLHAEQAALALAVAPSAPFVALGFVPVEGIAGTRFTARRAGRVEAEIEPGTCVVAVAAATDGPTSFVLERDGDKVDATGSIGFCTCARETVTATATATAHDGASRSVRLLAKDARSFGGTYGFARTRKPARVLDSPCSEEHLDGWLADTARSRPKPTTAESRAGANRERDGGSLRTSPGFAPLASADGGAPFLVIEPPAGSCTMVSTTDADDRLSLRVSGGARVVDGAAVPIAFCDSRASTYVVFHSGHGDIAAVHGPSVRLGGLIGVREAALQSAQPAPVSWLRTEDLAWDARAAVAASGVPESVSVDYAVPMPAMSLVHDARILSLSTTDGANVAPDSGPDLVVFSCAPELGKAAQSFCVQASRQRWRDTSSRGRAAGAEANLPYWLAAFASSHDPALVRVEAQLLALARRLTRAGFDATVLEAVTELPHGVDVTGRAGEDAIVAIALEPVAPWAVPCTNGKPWRIDGDPLVIDLLAGKHAVLAHGAPVTASKETRRTVVFRRTIKP